MPDIDFTPPEAIDAMVLALQSNGVNLYAIHARDEPVTPAMMRAVLATALTAGAEHLVQAEVTVTVRQCRICGCTDNEACPDGCSWSQPEICSTCARRQEIADIQYLATLQAQEVAAHEQAEMARMQREHLAASTWRLALKIAGERNLGGVVLGQQAEENAKEVLAEAEWFAHHLGNPPVVF